MGWVGRSANRAMHAPLPQTGVVRVLVADDNADMRDYVERLLGDRWNVETVPDGAAALASARARRPDVVVPTS
jgi:CheY-like chemotaxis protein